MKIRFLTPAQWEVNDAVQWYNDQKIGLGIEFLDELDMTVRRIAAFPESYREIEQGLRRCLLSRFPYVLIYGIDKKTIIIVAVAHLHREPRYWIERL
ncbi:MAG: type II toxin-antitoxin system RelE/ParE family toxin [Proteobacteria bacterium]|nr:type II toxin-antitoxin system RelE/ParE family toxin [Pseudomonadota bacterium]